MKYYKAKVGIRDIDDNGKLTNRNEEYLVDAVDPVDVCAKITAKFEEMYSGLGNTDFEIKSISTTKILEVIE